MARSADTINSRLWHGAAAILLPLIAGLALALASISTVQASADAKVTDVAKLVRVQLVNALDGKPIAGQRIVAREQVDGDKWLWRGQKNTDAYGKTSFEYARLRRKQGVVELRTRPYSNLVKVQVTEPGEYKVAAGRLAVLVVDHEQQPLANWRVTLREEVADGKYARRASGRTDSGGWVYLDAEAKSGGKPFLDAKSPFRTKTRKRVELPAWSGKHKIVLGSPPVNLTVVDGITGEPLAGLLVHAIEHRANGSQRHAGWQKTNENGKAVFNLDFGSGETDVDSPVYVFKTKPFKAGWVESSEVTKPGAFDFTVGTSPVTLVDNANPPNPISDVRLFAFWRDGEKHRWCCWGTTDETGTVRFDFVGVSPENPIVVWARNPLGDGKNVASGSVTASGPYTFVVGKDVDNEPPEVKIVNPASGATVHAKEFKVEVEARDQDGKNADQHGVTEVSVHLIGPALATRADTGPSNRTTVAAVYEPSTGLWAAKIVGLADGSYTAMASAKDKAGNEGKSRPRTVQVMSDTIPPEVAIKEPPEGTVLTPPLGNAVRVTGTATDDGGEVKAVFVELASSVNGGAVDPSSPRVTRVEAEYNPGTKTFTAELPENLFTPGDHRVTAIATDASGNEGKSRPRTVQVMSDTIPPEVAIKEPPEGTVLTPPLGNAVRVTGTATDDGGEVKAVFVELASSVNGGAVDPSSPRVTRVEAEYNPGTKTFTAELPENLFTPGDHRVTAIATDASGNEGKSRPRTIMVAADTQPPVVVIETPTNGADVSENGFTLAGTALDGQAGEIQSVTAALLTQGATTPVTLQVAFNPQTGRWSAMVGSQHLTAGETVDITVKATDRSGNSAELSIQLTVIAVGNEAFLRHLIDRITFGPDVELLQEVQNLGPDAFITQQLEEQMEPGFQQRVDDFRSLVEGYLPDPNAGYSTQRSQLQVYALQHAWRDPRQLRAVLAQFWDNHFSSDIDSHDIPDYELREHQGFRDNALGRFLDLLETSATSPAMLIYLNSLENCATDSNENYARELLELHTMDDKGFYQQDDVEALAEVFTGWTVTNGEFAFNPACHNSADKELSLVGEYGNLETYMIQGRSGPAGVDEGMEVLRYLAEHWSTAQFVCTKLAQLFVSDTPPETVVSDCRETFRATVEDRDQIGKAVRVILESDAFKDPENFRAKVTTPLEHVARTLRAFEAAGSGADLPTRMSYLSMRLFQNRAPDGFPEAGEDWINGNLLLERINFVTWLAHNSAGTNRSSVDPMALATANLFPAPSAEDIVDFFLGLALGADYTNEERDILLAILNADGGFDINQATADEKLRMMLATMLAFSKYQFQ